MHRKPVVLAVMLLLAFHSAGLASLVPVDSCDDDCPCDAAGTECLPGCEACLCAPAVRTLVTPEMTVHPVLALLGAASSSSLLLHHSAHPREIFHVPKSTLA